jgi:hypothetical protein
MRQLSKFVMLTGLLALSGCGADPQPAPKSAAPAIERGVFISATDCAATGKLTLDQCGDAIDKAVASHEAHAPDFAALDRCEAMFGQDRCDKGFDQRYRPRLQAFFVILAKPARAVPLYPPANNMIGFQSPSKQPINATDETLRVSVAALTVAHENAKLPSGSGEATSGSVAADVH